MSILKYSGEKHVTAEEAKKRLAGDGTPRASGPAVRGGTGHGVRH